MALEQIGVEATIQGLSSFRRGISQMEGDVRGFGSSADGIVPGLNRMGDSLLNIGTIAAGAVVAGLAAATAGAVAFAGGGIKAAIDMEDQMGNIAAVMNTTKDAIQPLSDLILELGIDPGLKVTAEEAAQAIELLARNGLSMTEILDGAAKSTVLLANATGADFGVAADIATDAMAIFGIGAEDMVGVVDSIVSVTTNSKFTIDDFSLAIRNGGAAADLMGVSLDDFNTVIAATAEEMGSGMRAGTGFRNFLMRLTPNGDKAAEAMMQLGLITEDGANQFFDASGNIKSMAEVSGVLQEALKDLTAQEQSAFLELIFGQDALGTAIGLANEGEEGFAALAESMSETDAAAAALERMDSVAGVFEILGGVIDTVKLQIGQAFLPLIRDLADNFLNIANTIGPAVVDIFGKVASAISGAIGFLSQGGDPILALVVALGRLDVPSETIKNIREFAESMRDFIGTVVSFVTEHAEAFKGAIMGIGAVLGASVIVSVLTTIAGVIATILSPIGLLVIGVAALGAAWQSNFGNIQGITFEIIGTIQELIAIFQEDGLLGVIMRLTESWNLNWAAIQETVSVAWTAILAIIDSVIAVLGPSITEMVEGFKGAFSSFAPIGENFARFWEVLGPLVGQQLTNIGALFVGLIGIVTSVVNGIINAINPFITTLGFVLNGVIEFVTGVIQTLVGLGEFIFGWISGNDEVMTGGWEKIKEGVTSIVLGLVEAIGGAIIGLARVISEIVGGIVEGVIEFFTNLYDELVGNSIIVDLVEDILELFFNLATDLINSVTEMVDDLISLVVTFAGDMIGKFVNMVNDIVDIFNRTDWGALGQAIIDGLVNAIRNGGAAVIGAITNLANSAIQAAKDALLSDSPSKVFMDIGTDIGTGLVIGIQSMQGTVQETIKALFDVGGALGGIGSGFASQLKNDVFPQMEEAIAGQQRTFDALKNRFAGNFGSVFGLESGEDVTQQKLIDAYFMAVHSGNEQMKNDVLEIWQAQNQLNASTAEYEAAQESIVALQKAQADLAFLQQQQELLDLITEHGLNASEILGGLELGLGADTQGLVEAMTRAIQAIIAQAEEQLDINSPSGIFKEIGKFITSGLAEGISQTATNPAHAMESMLAQMTPGVSSQAAMPSVINQPSTTTITKTANVDMTGAQISNDVDMQVLGEFILQKVAEAI